ncbi:MAG: TIGR02281 family clan AA aspartic protease [Variibacter sp.]
MNSNVVLFAIAALVLAGAASQIATKLDAAAPGNLSVTVKLPPSAPSPTPQMTVSPRKVVVPRDSRGHYALEASINGRRMDVMVDTGASVVALTKRDASRLGINPAGSDYTSEVHTANGTVRAARVTLDAIEIGDIRVRDVTGLVVPDDALSENLLGLSFLSQLKRYEFSDGRLVMEQ